MLFAPTPTQITDNIIIYATSIIVWHTHIFYNVTNLACWLYNII